MRTRVPVSLRRGHRAAIPYNSRMRRAIGRFRVEETIGEGGMGVVYRAVDPDLERAVAIKMLRNAGDAAARERLLREARAAAQLGHPGICQIYEVGQDGDDLFVAMELLSGESLGARVARGVLSLREASEIAIGILSALGTIHGAGLVHRDVKPSNVFLTPHGVKLLDFGLVRPSAGRVKTDDLALTAPGSVVGTPRYMAPEQWAGGEVGPAADLFAVGAVYYEMLTGQPAFRGNTALEVAEAILGKEPPALGGGPGGLAADRILQRALGKRPADRFPDAASMVRELSAILTSSDPTDVLPVRRARRVVAVPFRMLRADPEFDFLSFSLPDAIAASLAGIDGLTVRSTPASSGSAGVEIGRIAREHDVDAVLTGTLLRAGNRLRAAAQLVDAPSGTILCSVSTHLPLGDLLHLHDSLVRQVVEALAVPLTGGAERRPGGDVPASARAYEYYLRANRETNTSGFSRPILLARDLYRATVEEDPAFAPAWARLARAHRLIAKYGHGDRDENLRLSREAFERALSLDPDLPLAHDYFTYFQLEEEGESVEALTRLLQRARHRTSDPHLFAGLVVACRFCGLLEASVAAHRRARRLDPAIRTSVQYTWFMLGEYDRVLDTDYEDPPYLRHLAPGLLGRPEETLARFLEMEARGYEGTHRHEYLCTRAALEGNREVCVLAAGEFERSGFRDPEGIFLLARNLAWVGEHSMALQWLERAVRGGYSCSIALMRDPWLASVRAGAECALILRESEALHEAAARSYAECGGEAILGVPAK